jgi:hypothetical protein
MSNVVKDVACQGVTLVCPSVDALRRKLRLRFASRSSRAKRPYFAIAVNSADER